MARDKLDRTIDILELVAKIVVPLGKRILDELGRMRAIKASGKVLSEEDWEKADERFDEAIHSLLDELDDLDEAEGESGEPKVGDPLLVPLSGD